MRRSQTLISATPSDVYLCPQVARFLCKVPWQNWWSGDTDSLSLVVFPTGKSGSSHRSMCFDVSLGAGCLCKKPTGYHYRRLWSRRRIPYRCPLHLAFCAGQNTELGGQCTSLSPQRHQSISSEGPQTQVNRAQNKNDMRGSGEIAHP